MRVFHSAEAALSGAVHLVPMGQTTSDQGALSTTYKPRLHVLAGHHADGRR